MCTSLIQSKLPLPYLTHEATHQAGLLKQTAPNIAKVCKDETCMLL